MIVFIFLCSFADGSPEIAHDFRTVRMESLTILASKHNEQLYVEEAVEVHQPNMCHVF